MRSVVHAASRVPIVVAAAHEGKVEIWNCETGKKLSEFETVFDGCNRIALSSTGELLATANWRKGVNAGVACYETKSGAIVWHRTDLRQVQSMHFSPRNDRIWCEIESRPAHSLDACSGSTLQILRSISDVLDGSDSARLLLRRRIEFVIEYSGKRSSIPCLGTSPSIEAAFSPDAVCIHEAGNPGQVTVRAIIRCFNCGDGSQRWWIQPSDNYFLQSICYQDDGFFYGVLSGNDGKEWTVAIVRFAASDGACTEICRLNSPPPYFGGFGDGVLVTPDGDVVSLQSGTTLRHLDFGDA